MSIDSFSSACSRFLSTCNPLSKQHSSYKSFKHLPDEGKFIAVAFTSIAALIGAPFLLVGGVFAATYVFRKTVNWLQTRENRTVSKTNEFAKAQLSSDGKSLFNQDKSNNSENLNQKTQDRQTTEKEEHIQSTPTQPGPEKSENSKREPEQNQPAETAGATIETPPIQQKSECIIIGKAEWEQFFGDIGEVPKLPENYKELLEKTCPYYEGKKIKETHFFVLIPEKIDNMPLTLQHLATLVKGRGMELDVSLLEIDLPLDKMVNEEREAHWVLMPKELAKFSVNDYQSASVKNDYLSVTVKNEWEMPVLRDLLIAIYIEYFRSNGQNRLFSDLQIFAPSRRRGTNFMVENLVGNSRLSIKSQQINCTNFHSPCVLSRIIGPKPKGLY